MRPELTGRPSEVKGARPRRRRVRPRRRLRARQARLRLPASSKRAIASAGCTWTVRRGTEHTEVGGERQVCTFDEGQYVNVGAVAHPVLAHRRAELLQGARRSAADVPQRGRRVVLLLRGQRRGLAVEQAGAAARGQGRHDRPHQRAAGQGDRSAPARSAADRGGSAAARQLSRRTGLSRFAGPRATRRSTNRGAGDPYEFSALLQSGFGNRLRSIPALEGTTAAPMFQPVGGMDQFPKGFQRAIGRNRITFNAEVQSVHQSDTGVKVVYSNTKSGKKTEVTADYVVVCMPLSVLAGVDINLSPEMMAGGKADDLQQQRQDGAGDEAPVLGGGRPDLRRPPLLEPAARRVLVSVARLLLEEGRAARPLRERPGRQPARSAGQGRASSTC